MSTLSIFIMLTVTCSTTIQSKLLHLHKNNCYKNMPQYYVLRTLLILLVTFSIRSYFSSHFLIHLLWNSWWFI